MKKITIVHVSRPMNEFASYKELKTIIHKGLQIHYIYLNCAYTLISVLKTEG